MCIYWICFPIVYDAQWFGVRENPLTTPTLSCPPSGHAVASGLHDSGWTKLGGSSPLDHKKPSFWLADCRGETDGKLSTARTGNRQYTWSLPVSEKREPKGSCKLRQGNRGMKSPAFQRFVFHFALDIFLMAGLGFSVAARSLWSLSRDDKSCSYAGFVCFVMSDVNTCCGSCWGSSLAQENEQL